MQITLLKSKIHRAAVTGASLHYEGSLTVPADIAEMVGLLPYEKILVGNLQNGERFETYVIYGPAGKGLIELNGATARLGAIGDRLTIMSFAQLTLGRSEDPSSARGRARCAKPGRSLRASQDEGRAERAGTDDSGRVIWRMSRARTSRTVSVASAEDTPCVDGKSSRTARRVRSSALGDAAPPRLQRQLAVRS